MMRRAGLAALGALLALAAHAEPFSFAAFGDTPYSKAERQALPAMLAQMDAQPLAFVLHVGDIKSGEAPCDDAVYADRLALFETSRHAFLYTPGDNEWADCHRRAAGAFDPLERLRHLRAVLFARAPLGRSTLAVQRQGGATGLPENLRWRRGGVLFLTLHVVGSDNHRGKAGTPARAEFLARQRANLAWLGEAFALARRERLAGVVVAMQADPGFERLAIGHPRPPYRKLLKALRREVEGFPGQVLLIHGDTHWQRVDRPLRDARTRRPITNFTRLEVYGSPFMGWVKVTVDADAPGLFSFEPQPYTR